MKKSAIIIITAVAVALAGIMAWTLVRNKKNIDSKKEIQTVNTEIAVSVTSVEMRTINGNLNLVGTAEANRTVVVASESAGKITQINFKLGDYVTKGTVLAQVDDTYKHLALDNAAINYDKYKEDYERYQTLRKGDAVSETQLRDMKVAYENASIQLESTKKQVSDTRIVAPFSGYITSKNVEQGAYVNVATAIAGMVDVSALKVSLSVSESNVYLLKAGQPADVTTPIHPQANYKGTVSHISPQGDNGHTYPIEIMVPNSTEYPLKAGTYVNVQINMGASEPALMIPREGIVSSVKDPSVYRVEGNTVKLIKITIGRDYDNNIEVLQGLKQGDKVVTNGQINLMDGAPISITE